MKKCRSLAISVLLCLLTGCSFTPQETLPETPAIKTFPTAAPEEETFSAGADETAGEESSGSVSWQSVYRAYLEKVAEEQPELRFALLYIDSDQIPELCFYQETCLDIYSYRNGSMFYAIRFPTGYYTNDFSYRPKEGMLVSQQGSVMGDEGTYMQIQVYQRTQEGLAHAESYLFAESDAQQTFLENSSMAADTDTLIGMDVVPSATGGYTLGESWISYTLPEEKSAIQFSTITEESLNELFGDA